MVVVYMKLNYLIKIGKKQCLNKIRTFMSIMRLGRILIKQAKGD